MNILKIFLLISIFFQLIISQENNFFYRCGADDNNIAPIPAKNYVKIDNQDRRLNDNEEQFKDFNIYLDLINIKNDIKKYKLQQYENLFINSLKKAVETLETLLKVKKQKRFIPFMIKILKIF